VTSFVFQPDKPLVIYLNLWKKLIMGLLASRQVRRVWHWSNYLRWSLGNSSCFSF